MSAPIGPEGLTPHARAMLENVRVDPRRARSKDEHGRPINDFWDAVEEAERLREVGVWGLQELAQALEHEEARLGVHRGDPGMDEITTRALQAAWERAAIAEAELRNEHPQLNAMALIALVSALDAFIEDMLLDARRFLLRISATDQLQHLPPESGFAQRPEEEREALIDQVVEELYKKLPKPPRLWGVGLQRFERVLADVGLNAPADGTMPADLDVAMTELVALRHVLVHRAGRVDAKSKADAPTLTYSVGEFIRFDRDAYRKYSAAVCAYGSTVSYRVWGPTSEELDLSDWRDHYRINA